ncbi:hypothetical protein BCR42DRAFT_485404 [Absidia repens]|uniref:HCP-like protein n=1 Tax=Absidia repens TaxID=90262 RepID=A0A1X2J045_9FUNG|nr:hypothetical protein BCR42DRAFT_485404 [Absidia repens]
MRGILSPSFIVGCPEENETSCNTDMSDTTNTMKTVPLKKRPHPLSSDITDQHALLQSIKKQYYMATLPYILKPGDDGFGSRMELIDSCKSNKTEVTLDLAEMTLDLADTLSPAKINVTGQALGTDTLMLHNDSSPSMQHDETIKSPTSPPPIHAEQKQEYHIYEDLSSMTEYNSSARHSGESINATRSSNSGDSHEPYLHDDGKQMQHPPPLPQHLSPLPTAAPPSQPQHSSPPSPPQHSSPPSPSPPTTLPLHLLPLPPLPEEDQEKPLPTSATQHHYDQSPPVPKKHHDYYQIKQQPVLPPPVPRHEVNHSPCPTRTPLSFSANSSSSSFTTIDTSGTLQLDSVAKDMISDMENDTLFKEGQLGPMPSSSSPPLNLKTSMPGGQTSPDGDYFPDSSLYAASLTKPAPNPLSLKPHHPHFPPATLENLNNFRKETQALPDEPALQLNFAKYLMEAVEQLQIDDKTRSIKAKTAMMTEAHRIVKKLAMKSKIGQSGYADAQFYLANAYGAGLMLLLVNHEKAFALYLQGSKQCHPGCTYRVGVCYELGLGTRKNHARAIKFYRKAAKLGDPSAMYKLAMVLLHGLLEAISWLKRAAPLADAYHPEILHELGSIYETEDIPSVIPDQEYAYELLTKAARFGYAPSQYKLGVAYENGIWEYPVDPRRSIAWYSKAVEQGHLESALALSGWYLTGASGSDGESILPQDDLEAYLWARKAADAGYAKGQYACGYYTESGIGVATSMDEARLWYERAAEQDYGKAMQRLMELKGNTANSNSNHRRQRKKQQRPLSLQPSQVNLGKITETEWKSANHQNQRRYTWTLPESSSLEHDRSSCQIM